MTHLDHTYIGRGAPPPRTQTFTVQCTQQDVFDYFSHTVPSAPVDVKAVTSSATSVIVSWKSPALPNGLIQRYTVYRRQVLNGQEVSLRYEFVGIK